MRQQPGNHLLFTMPVCSPVSCQSLAEDFRLLYLRTLRVPVSDMRLLHATTSALMALQVRTIHVAFRERFSGIGTYAIADRIEPVRHRNLRVHLRASSI